MNQLVIAKVTIRGTRPLFWSWFGPDALPLEKQERTGVAGNDPQEWRRTTLVTSEGQLYLDGTYVFGMMREAGKRIKRNRANVSKDVSATLQVQDAVVLVDRWFPNFPNGHVFDIGVAEPPLRDPMLPVYLDVRGAVNPTTRARNVRYRVAASPGWTATWGMEWDKTVVGRDLMESVLIEGSKFVGIGNGRVIGMGRFEIVQFDVNEA